MIDNVPLTLLYQIIGSLFAAGVVWGVVKSDIKNLHARLSEERRLREDHAKEDDKSFHDIRDHLVAYHGRISRMEGANDAIDRLADAIRTSAKKG